MGGSRRTILNRVQNALNDWSVPRQMAGEDPLGKAAESSASRALRPRLADAERVGTSICPYCAVGCAQLIYAKGNQGTLCPKGSATAGWINNPRRLTRVKYRRPYSDHWEEVPLGLHRIQIFRGRGAGPAGTLAAIAALAGGFCLRAVFLFGGKLSANRPQDYFRMTQPK